VTICQSYLAGNSKLDVKDNFNAELVEFMKDIFELHVLSQRQDLILASIWSLDEMWTIYPA
jgi:hypothetical protein